MMKMAMLKATSDKRLLVSVVILLSAWHPANAFLNPSLHVKRGVFLIGSPPSNAFVSKLFAFVPNPEPERLFSFPLTVSNEFSAPTNPEKQAEERFLPEDGSQQQPLQPHSTSSSSPLANILEKLSMNMGRLIVLVASAMYGTNFATVKMLDEHLPVAVSAALRFSLAAAVVTGIVFSQEQQQASATTTTYNMDVLVQDDERNKALWAGAEVGAWYSAGYLSQAIGLSTCDASKGAFFSALAVIVVPVLDSFFKGKQISTKGRGSIALALIGVALLQLGPAVLSGRGDMILSSVSTGDLFCLAQALFFGIGYWRLEDVAQRHPGQAGRSTAGQLLGLAGGSLLYCVGSGAVPSLPDLQSWLSDPFIVQALAWTGLVSTALALYLETVALKVVSASELTVLMTSISLWGAGFAYVTIGETLSKVGMVGGLAILAGCLLSSSSSSSSSSSTGDSGDILILAQQEDPMIVHQNAAVSEVNFESSPPLPADMVADVALAGAGAGAGDSSVLQDCFEINDGMR